MSRLHLVTSRRPLLGAISAGDHLVFMEAEAVDKLASQLLQEDPSLATTSFHVLSKEGELSLGFRPIGYEALVALCASCASVVSW